MRLDKLFGPMLLGAAVAMLPGLALVTQALAVALAIAPAIALAAHRGPDAPAPGAVRSKR